MRTSTRTPKGRHNSRAIPVLLFFFLFVFAAVPPLRGADEREPGVLSPNLRTYLSTASSDELVPVIIVLSEQTNATALLPTLQGLPRSERRAVAKAELRRVAERTQAPLLDFLEAEESAGRAERIRSLWVANGILVNATPASIERLAQTSGVRTILWDRDIPDEEALDTGEIVPFPRERASRGTEIWQLETLRAPETWARGYRGQGVVVAIQDNGVDRTHADLADHIWQNSGEIAGNGIDDDDNGYVDDTWGWDFANNDNEPMPSGDDHGTKCAGIVAGDGTEGTATGVAPEALIMACFVNTWGQNIEGIQYAIDNGADVISMSRSEKWRFTPKPDYDWWRSVTDGELLTGIHHANSIGNEGDNQGTDPIPFNIAAPGCCPTPWAHPDQVQAGVSGITAGVGAIDINDGIASYSSIGPFAWEDIGFNWPEYPHTMRSEYQDYPYSGGLPGLIKPDVVAPGPGTISINIGSGYGSFGGTSAATPHVAGAMALVLGAYPEISPAEMAMVLQTTALDLGPAGKDVTFGAGKVDCFEGALLAEQMNDFGSVAGRVLELGTGEPVPGVRVEATDSNYFTTSDADGVYELGLPEGSYELLATNFYFAPESRLITISASDTTPLDIEMTRLPANDISGFVRLDGSSAPRAGTRVTLEGTPLATIRTSLDGRYRFRGVPVGTYELTAERFGYVPETTTVEVTIESETVQDFDLDPAIVAFDMESDPEWSAGVAGDDATTGIWERVDPNGTEAQPEDDHTEFPGLQCWVTGQGTVGGSVGENDVDGGSTTLRTGPIDLGTAVDPVISYWSWYSNNAGSAIDDEWVVQISGDGGDSWVDVIRSSENAARWQLVEFAVADFITPSSDVRVQWIASDLGSGSIVEAAIDDFQVFGAEDPSSMPGSPGSTDTTVLRFAGSHPNPFEEGAVLRFALTEETRVRLAVYDVSGRQVRELIADSAPVAAGTHEVTWDGRDAGGREVGSGVYYYRLETGNETVSRRAVRMK